MEKQNTLSSSSNNTKQSQNTYPHSSNQNNITNNSNVQQIRSDTENNYSNNNISSSNAASVSSSLINNNLLSTVNIDNNEDTHNSYLDKRIVPRSNNIRNTISSNNNIVYPHNTGTYTNNNTNNNIVNPSINNVHNNNISNVIESQSMNYSNNIVNHPSNLNNLNNNNLPYNHNNQLPNNANNNNNNNNQNSIVNNTNVNINNQNSHNTYKSNISDSSTRASGVDFDKICGYNPFMKEIFSRVTCSICTLIPFEPLECKNCNAVVCKQCIEKWKRKECILKCGGEHYDLPSRILRDIINSIVIKCKNASKGCDAQLRIDNMRAHEAECDFDEIKCPFPDCILFDLRKNINLHIDLCEYNKIKCQFCNNLFKKVDFNSHIENDCKEVLIECEKCSKSEKRKNFSKHNCITALKDENKDLQTTISNLLNSVEVMKTQNEEIGKQLDEERRLFNEKKTLMNLMINLLKSCNENDDLKGKSYNTCNPIQIPYIFRFMTSSRTLQITNLADYTFTKINLMINFEIPTSHQSIVTSAKRIFIVGGVNHEKKTYEFDVLNKTLIEHAEMIVGRRRHILTELRPGVFIATGGSNQNEEVLRDCEAFIVGKNTWIKISSLNYPRFYHTAFSYKGSSLYVIGGCHTNNSSLVNLNTIERIELSRDLNGSWEILSVKDLSLLKPRSRLSYLFINSEKILLFGGIPDYQAVFFDIAKSEIFLADSQFNIEGRFFFNDRCTWKNETLFISSQSSRCIFNHTLNTWELKEFNEDNN